MWVKVINWKENVVGLISPLFPFLLKLYMNDNIREIKHSRESQIRWNLNVSLNVLIYADNLTLLDTSAQYS